MTAPARRLLQQFARYPEPGAVKTRLCAQLTAAEACAVHEALLLHTARGLVGAAICPCELWLDRVEHHPTLERALRLGMLGPYQQAPGDLGEKMYAALSAGLSRAEQIVLVGSDCPDLDARYLSQAFDALVTTDIVLGPAEDGGYVLIGCRRIATGMFDAVRWGTPAALSETRRALGRCGLSVVLLEERYDVDTPEDLQRWRRAGDPRVSRHGLTRDQAG